MKSMKFIIILFALLFFLPLNAEAKISRNYDSFEGLTFITSTNTNLDFFTFANFTKGYGQDPARPTYLLSFGKISYKEWWFFSRDKVKMKIDGTDIHEIPVYDTHHEYKSMGRNLELFTTNTLNLTPLADKLKTAQSVTFRIYFENQPYVDLVVPDKVLAEWKEVINTEK